MTRRRDLPEWFTARLDAPSAWASVGISEEHFPNVLALIYALCQEPSLRTWRTKFWEPLVSLDAWWPTLARSIDWSKEPPEEILSTVEQQIAAEAGLRTFLPSACVGWAADVRLFAYRHIVLVESLLTEDPTATEPHPAILAKLPAGLRALPPEERVLLPAYRMSYCLAAGPLAAAELRRRTAGRTGYASLLALLSERFAYAGWGAVIAPAGPEKVAEILEVIRKTAWDLPGMQAALGRLRSTRTRGSELRRDGRVRRKPLTAAEKSAERADVDAEMLLALPDGLVALARMLRGDLKDADAAPMLRDAIKRGARKERPLIEATKERPLIEVTVETRSEQPLPGQKTEVEKIEALLALIARDPQLRDLLDDPEAESPGLHPRLASEAERAWMRLRVIADHLGMDPKTLGGWLEELRRTSP